MSVVRRAVVCIAVGAAVGAGPALAGPASADTGTPHHRDLRALLTGAQEVPGPGDSDAWGAANVRVWPERGTLCYTLFVRRVNGVVNGAHIHAGTRGETGKVVVSLKAPVRGWSAGCTTLAKADAAAIATAPRRFYVNVHSDVFAGGAVRGQLRGQRTR